MGRHSGPDDDATGDDAGDSYRQPYQPEHRGGNAGGDLYADQPDYTGQPLSRYQSTSGPAGQTGDRGGEGYGNGGYLSDDYSTDDYDDTEYDDADYVDSDYNGDNYSGDNYSRDDYRRDDYGTESHGDSNYDTEYDDTDYDDGDFDESDYRNADRGGWRAEASGGSDDGGAEGPATGGHRFGGEWTGSHRVLSPGRRGVSTGVIVALATVVAVVGGFILWQFFGDALKDRSNDAAGRCIDGDATVAVIADGALAEQLSQFAGKFNQTAGPVGDHCVKVSVKAADSNTVVAGLVGEWPADQGDKPALWIPGSSIASARLQAAAGPEVVSTSNSLVSSPVLLAMRPDLKPALQEQNWGTLPRLQADPAALDGLDLPGWGALRLAAPRTGNSDADALAGEAIAVASAAPGAPAISGLEPARALLDGGPKLSNDSLDEAMTTLLSASDPAASQVHAVITTEQQAIKRATDLSDAQGTLATWLPPGSVAVADFPVVVLAGPWLAEEQVAGASEFERFLREPEQQEELAKAGFRVAGSPAPTSAVTSGGDLGQTLSVGDESVRVALANALSGAPGGGSAAVSIMLDKSLNLAAVTPVLSTRIKDLPADAEVGLTTFDGSASSVVVPLGGLGADVDGESRRDALTGALTALSPSGGAVSFTSLRNVYADALTNFAAGHQNSVLVITSGPHTDRSLDSGGLQDLIKQSFDPARPVAVNVINVGTDTDRPTWESVAAISGGRYLSVPASDSPEMAAAINQLLA